MAKPQSALIDSWKAEFVAQDLITQEVTLDELTALHNQAKEQRRQELKAELGSLNDWPTKGKAKPPSSKPKYRSLRNPALTWGGRGAVAGWLKKEMEETMKPLEAFKV